MTTLSGYRETLLDTDARIIAEDATHIVVAVRVAKECIAANLPFFAAVAARAAPQSFPARRGLAASAAFGVLIFTADEACRVLAHPAALALNWAVDLVTLAMAAI